MTENHCKEVARHSNKKIPYFDSLMWLDALIARKMSKFIFKYCYIFSDNFHLLVGTEGKIYQIW